jgi:multidrug efflux pump subunit AcrA (membrane-fusion protein)
VQAQGICSVWVVASDSTVRYREVQVGDTQGDAWCIESGLEPGERVLLTGLQKVRNGMKIHYK